jgi:hypothetical protein
LRVHVGPTRWRNLQWWRRMRWRCSSKPRIRWPHQNGLVSSSLKIFLGIWVGSGRACWMADLLPFVPLELWYWSFLHFCDYR